jgi:hypothetical protein
MLFDEATIVSELDDEASSSSESVIVAKCWSFLVRSIRSGLVVDSLPHLYHDAEGNVRADEALHDHCRSSSLKLGPRAGQEWTLVASLPLETQQYEDEDNEDEWGSSSCSCSCTSHIQLVNPTTQQRLACERVPWKLPERNQADGALQPASAQEGHCAAYGHRVVAISVASLRQHYREYDPHWAISRDGTILSASSGLALTDDGHGNLTLQPLASSAGPTSLGQQWQLIPML